MKNITTLMLLFSFCFGYAQVGINTTSPSSNAVLHLESLDAATVSYGGLLIPRVSEIQQTSIPVSLIDDVDDGLLVFVNDPISGKRCLEIYDSYMQTWRTMFCSNAGTASLCGGIPQILYEEDFESYAADTGIRGGFSTNSGDYPAGVTKWTLTSFSAYGSSTPNNPGTLVNIDDYGLVQNGELAFRDTNGAFRFQTQSIDISGYSDIEITMDLRERGVLEYVSANHTNDFTCGDTANDYIDIEYSIDGGSTYIEVSNYNTLGNANHTIIDEMNAVVNVAISGISGSNLIVRVRLQNWSDSEYYYLDNIKVTCN